MTTIEAEEGGAGTDRLAGAILIGTAAVSAFAMAHHPTHVDAIGLGRVVHGVLILFLAAIAFGFAHFAIRRGLRRPAVLAGLVAYGVAIFGGIGAATIDGFAVPALAAELGGSVEGDVFRLTWQLNQALAGLGMVGTGLAIFLWSLDLLRGPARGVRLTGAIGLLAGAVPPLLLVTGTISMNLAGAGLAYAVHWAWTALLGLQLVLGAVGREATS
jgi:magnesium-transporting ATPase (P-type)